MDDGKWPVCNVGLSWFIYFYPQEPRVCPEAKPEGPKVWPEGPYPRADPATNHQPIGTTNHISIKVSSRVYASCKIPWPQGTINHTSIRVSFWNYISYQISRHLGTIHHISIKVSCRVYTSCKIPRPLARINHISIRVSCRLYTNCKIPRPLWTIKHISITFYLPFILTLEKVKNGKRPTCMTSAEGSLFRQIFQKNDVEYSNPKKVIRHCACAVKWASLRRRSFRSGQTLRPARIFTMVSNGVLPWYPMVFTMLDCHPKPIGCRIFETRYPTTALQPHEPSSTRCLAAPSLKPPQESCRKAFGKVADAGGRVVQQSLPVGSCEPVRYMHFSFLALVGKTAKSRGSDCFTSCWRCQVLLEDPGKKTRLCLYMLCWYMLVIFFPLCHADANHYPRIPLCLFSLGRFQGTWRNWYSLFAGISWNKLEPPNRFSLSHSKVSKAGKAIRPTLKSPSRPLETGFPGIWAILVAWPTDLGILTSGLTRSHDFSPM